MRLRLAGEQEGHVVDLEGRFDLRDHRIGDDAHVHRAEPHAVQHRAFVAQRAVREQLHVHAFADAALEPLLEQPRAGRVGVLRAVAAGPADAQHGAALRAQHGGRRGRWRGWRRRGRGGSSGSSGFPPSARSAPGSCARMIGAAARAGKPGQPSVISRPKPGTASRDAAAAQRMPGHDLVAGDDRHAELRLQRRDQRRGADRGAGDEAGFGTRRCRRGGAHLVADALRRQRRHLGIGVRARASTRRPR